MRMSFTVLGAILCAVLFGCKSVESTADLPPVTGFDAEKYMGQWYEIARFPHSFERDFTMSRHSIPWKRTARSGWRTGAISRMER